MTYLTNRISSAVQARDALASLKSKGALFRVELMAMFVEISFEGYIKDFDGGALTIEWPHNLVNARPNFTLGGLAIAKYDGDFRDDADEMFLALTVTRTVGVGPDDFYRIHLTARWSKRDKHVN